MKRLISFFKKHKIAPWAGIIGSILFIAVFTIEGLMRQNYDAFRMYISELALGPRGWIQIANFIIFGILLLVFTLSLANKFKGKRESKIGQALIAIIGINFILAGVFVIDPSAEKSLNGIIHNVSSALIFFLASISCFIFFHLFREDPKWKNLSWWTLTTGIAILVLIVLMEMDGTSLSEWPGAIQRIAAITGLFWIFTFALKVLKEDKKKNEDN
jgi:hypothetical membrane protein